jgi:hypothetical protein
VDTGGMIVMGADGLGWIDLLTEHAVVPYGEIDTIFLID